MVQRQRPLSPLGGGHKKGNMKNRRKSDFPMQEFLCALSAQLYVRGMVQESVNNLSVVSNRVRSSTSSTVGPGSVRQLPGSQTLGGVDQHGLPRNRASQVRQGLEEWWEAQHTWRITKLWR